MCFFFFNDTATTEIYTLSLHDALPISSLSTLVVFHVAVQASPHRFLERLCFVHCLILAPWSQMGCPCMFELGSGLSILFRGSVCLFLDPGCAVSVPSALSSMLKSESVIRPALFVFLRIPWPIQGLLLLAGNFGILSSISLANMAATFTGIAWNPEILCSGKDVSRVLILPFLGNGIS